MINSGFFTILKFYCNLTTRTPLLFEAYTSFPTLCYFLSSVRLITNPKIHRYAGEALKIVPEDDNSRLVGENHGPKPRET